MRIAVAGDHTAVAHRRAIVAHLLAQGHDVLDQGTDSEVSCDYPDYAAKACTLMVQGQAERAVLICGTGIGMSIVANKFPGLRCGLAHDQDTARLAAAHNRAQVLALGARVIDIPTALKLVQTWIETPFEDRHQRRLDKITAIESSHCTPPDRT